VTDIVRDKGIIHPLTHKDIPPELQEKYIELLRVFIKNGDNSNE
jgi:hypothetical protein